MTIEKSPKKEQEKTNELFFKSQKAAITSEEWEKRGKPKLWYEMYNKNGVIIYEDRAFGKIKLITPAGESEGSSIAVVGKIIAFGPYYNGVLKIYTPYSRK